MMVKLIHIFVCGSTLLRFINRDNSINIADDENTYNHSKTEIINVTAIKPKTLLHLNYKTFFLYEPNRRRKF